MVVLSPPGKHEPVQALEVARAPQSRQSTPSRSSMRPCAS